MKRVLTMMTAAAAMLALSITALAAGWAQDAAGWRWVNDDGSLLRSGWYWLDGNRDGIAESYCFNDAGYIYQNTTTPDQYTVNADGAWTINGVVQTRSAGITAGNILIPASAAGAAAAEQAAQQQAAADHAAAPSVSVEGLQIGQAQAESIAAYLADCLLTFKRSNGFFGTETSRSDLSYDQVVELARYYGLYIRDPRVSSGTGPVFVNKDDFNVIMKEVFGKNGRPAIDRLENNVMIMGDQYVFNYGNHEGRYTVSPGTVQYQVENGQLKLTAGMNPVRDNADDGYIVAWFSPSGAAGLYGLTFERIELKKYR